MLILDFFLHNTVGSIILVLIGVGLGIWLIYRINAILRNLADSISAKYRLYSTQATITRGEAINRYKELYDMVEDAIEIEVVNTLNKYVAVSARYPFNTLDDDIKRISNNVYGMLKMDEILRMGLPIDPKYIQHIIVDSTKRLLIEAGMRVNEQTPPPSTGSATVFTF